MKSNKQKYLTWTFGVLAVLFMALFINAKLDDGHYTYLPFQKIGTTVDKTFGTSLEGTGNTFAVKLPTKLDFAGEEVPLNDLEVKERLDRELLVNTYWQSNTLLVLKRANRWFPVIEKILRENDVPDDFKYLAVIESNLTDVVSPSGAAGFWQFLKTTGQLYGLEVNDQIDERYNVELATRAACKYLIEAKGKLGSWTDAAASYNMGMAGVQKQLDRQGESSYYDMSLGSETSRYVFRILALKLIHQHPNDFGIVLTPDDLYPPYKYHEETLSGSVTSFASYADARGISYKELKMLNSWIRDNALYNKLGKTYTVKILDK